MKFAREDRYFSRSDEGYCISAVAGLHGVGWKFIAWSPEIPAWRQGEKQTYTRGESVPRPRVILGVFDNSDAAVRACEEHNDKRIAVGE